jgi:hypothetical protein
LVGNTINWPDILKREEFLETRVKLDILFSEGTPDRVGRESDYCQQIQSLTTEMREQLRAIMRQISPSEYLAARKFIDALALEAQLKSAKSPVG